jgi:two-component system cell cycle response regulator DivK
MLPSGVRTRLHVVLVVEDNADLRALYGHALRASGLAVVDVGSGREALARAEELGPDLILLDRQSPLDEGWAIARALKANPATCHVPIVAVATHHARGDVERALIAGCDAFLEKGSSADALVRYVRGMLGLPLDKTDEHAVLETARASKR